MSPTSPKTFCHSLSCKNNQACTECHKRFGIASLPNHARETWLTASPSNLQKKRVWSKVVGSQWYLQNMQTGGNLCMPNFMENSHGFQSCTNQMRLKCINWKDRNASGPNTWPEASHDAIPQPGSSPGKKLFFISWWFLYQHFPPLYFPHHILITPTDTDAKPRNSHLVTRQKALANPPLVYPCATFQTDSMSIYPELRMIMNQIHTSVQCGIIPTGPMLNSVNPHQTHLQ